MAEIKNFSSQEVKILAEKHGTLIDKSVPGKPSFNGEISCLRKKYFFYKDNTVVIIEEELRAEIRSSYWGGGGIFWFPTGSFNVIFE